MARPFVWTEAKQTALERIHKGVYQREIAEELGVSLRTVEGWARRAGFRAKLEPLRQADRERWEADWQANLAAIRNASASASTRHIPTPEEIRAETDAWLAERQQVWERRSHRTR